MKSYTFKIIRKNCTLKVCKKISSNKNNNKSNKQTNNNKNIWLYFQSWIFNKTTYMYMH